MLQKMSQAGLVVASITGCYIVPPLFLELLSCAVTGMYQICFHFGDTLLEIITMQTIFNSFMKWNY